MWNQIFGVKEQELAGRIVRQIEDELIGIHIPQPIFIVGASGAGKSTILNFLVSRLEKGDTVNAFVVVLDGKMFFCSQDIISSIEKRDCEEGEFLDENKSRRIVIIDNLDYYFKRASFEDQYILRKYLNRESAPVLIATVSEIGDYLADYKAPFFEGIRILYVPKLEESSVEKMDLAERLAELMKWLPPVVRSFRIASEIVSLSDDKDADIVNLLARFEDGYRKAFENLPVNSQKILIALSASQNPLSLSELRQLTCMQSGILSSYLRQLVKSDMIKKINPKGHGTPYEICDKLFKLWLTPNFR